MRAFLDTNVIFYEQARCGVILSEDLNPGQTYAGVRVENPFA